ncbi:MAG: hypothetical protein IJ494_09625 [Bacteroides sp.]|nr:hypothetical protein [Bacteroides sp.]
MKKTLFLLLVLLCACSKDNTLVPPGEDDDNNGNDTPTEITLSDEYLPLTDENATFSNYDEKNGSVEITISDPTLVPQVGQVFVVTGEAMGAIRRITAVNTKTQPYKVQTEQAVMGDIFKSGTFTLSTSTLTNDAVTRSGRNVYHPTRIVYMEGDSIQTRGTITKRLLEEELELVELPPLWTSIDGKSSLAFNAGTIETSLDIELDFNFDNVKQLVNNYKSNLIEMSASLVGEVNASLGLTFTSSGGFEEESKEVVTQKDFIRPVGAWFSVGPPPGVPVYVSCRTDLLGDCELKVEGEFTATVGAEYNLRTEAGFRYSQATNSLSHFSETEESIEAVPPTLTAELSIETKASAYPRVYVYLYGLVGPVIDIKPFLKQEGKGSLEMNLGENKIGASLTYGASIGMDLKSTLHLNPFIRSNEKDIEGYEDELFCWEFYRSPHKVKKKSESTFGSNQVTFVVYDTLACAETIIPTSLPSPVVVSSHKYGSDGEDENEDATGVGTIVQVQCANENGEVTVSCPSNTMKTIKAAVYDERGTQISKDTHDVDIRELLIKLYQSTNGDNWTNNTNWCSDKPITEWYGVGYYEEEGEIHLELAENNLQGTIDISGCDVIALLRCEDNHLTAVNVSGCTRLLKLQCQNNQITQIETLGCSSLEAINCEHNKITSVIPEHLYYILSEYDQRYTNYRYVNDVLVWDDNEVGWWFPGEPYKGYHGI